MIDKYSGFLYNLTMEKPKQPGGRPRGRSFVHAKTLRFRDEDVERLRTLSEAWGCSESAVIRRLLAEATQREAGLGKEETEK